MKTFAGQPSFSTFRYQYRRNHSGQVLTEITKEDLKPYLLEDLKLPALILKGIGQKLPG